MSVNPSQNSEPHIPGSVDPGEPPITLKVEVVQRRTIEIGVYLPWAEAWRRREELAAHYLKDDAGEQVWTVDRYSMEGNGSR
jgi:hypothetical protein